MNKKSLVATYLSGILMSSVLCGSLRHSGIPSCSILFIIHVNGEDKVIKANI